MTSLISRSATCLIAVSWLAGSLETRAQELHFQRRLTEVNDVSKQSIECTLDATRIIRQQNQLVDQSAQQLQRRQVRTVTILTVANHRPTRARIDYAKSFTKAQNGDDPVVQITHPVANRSYFVERRGEELRLQTADGTQPSAEEEEILRRHLATFGKPNPLAQFLHDKRIRVGSSILVPQEVARELLGLTGTNGETRELTLKLVDAIRIDGRTCGLFETVLRTHHVDASMNLIMRGQLTIEADSCQTRSISLQGPVAMSETRGPVQGRFTVSTNGTLQVLVEANFNQPVRLGNKRAPQPTR